MLGSKKGDMDDIVMPEPVMETDGANALETILRVSVEMKDRITSFPGAVVMAVLETSILQFETVTVDALSSVNS